MIFLLNNGPGRFGNHLYNLFYLVNLSKKYEQNYWIYNGNYLLKYFQLEKLNFNNQKFLNQFKIIRTDNINSELSTNYNYILKPPILGNSFFDFYNGDLGFQIKKKLDPSYLDIKKYNVAVHFRGKDFHQWDKNSILEFEYYYKCINDLIQKKSNVVYYLFTDDLDMESYRLTIKYLKSNHLIFYHGQPNQNFFFDFELMSECNCVISSPSTFSLWASFLGKKNKSFYISNKWLNYRIGENDKFWIGLSIYGPNIFKNFNLM